MYRSGLCGGGRPGAEAGSAGVGATAGTELGGTVEQYDLETGNKRFGIYLRRVREGRRLSLDTVEEMSAGFRERVTKSHLSRIENGQAVPSFPRLFTLSRIYGVPIATIAERFDLELQKDLAPREVEERAPAESLQLGKQLTLSGRYDEALVVFSAALDAIHGQPDEGAGLGLDLRLGFVNCLVHLGRLEFAKAETEEILSVPGLSAVRHLMALQFFVICCYRLKKYTVASMALEIAEREQDAPEIPALARADLAAIRANVLLAMGRKDRSLAAYRDALEQYEKLPNSFEACRTRVNLACALMESGEEAAAREHLERALAEADTRGYDRQRALALSHLAVLAYGKGDRAAAETYALRSNAIARPREYLAVVFRNCYYLWQIARARGDEAGVKANERTLRAYMGRLEEEVPEVAAYRSQAAGGQV